MFSTSCAASRWLAVALVALVAFASPQEALAQATAGKAFPDRPVRLLLPYSPGTQSDAIGRLVAKKLGDQFGQQVVVENKPGANGILATEAVAKSPADGYTVLLGANAVMAFNPFVYTKIPYDPIKDFAAVAGLYASPYVLVAHPSMPFNSLTELIAAARTSPGKLQYASYGIASASHIAGEMFSQLAKIQLGHIPYKAAPTTDLLGGQVMMAFESFSTALPHIKSGKLKALGITGAQRAASLPDVPAIGEVLPGYEFVGWVALFVPRATPAPIVKTLSDAVLQVVASEEFREEASKRGLITLPKGSREIEALLVSEMTKAKSVVQTAGIRLD